MNRNSITRIFLAALLLAVAFGCANAQPPVDPKDKKDETKKVEKKDEKKVDPKADEKKADAPKMNSIQKKLTEEGEAKVHGNTITLNSTKKAEIVVLAVIRTEAETVTVVVLQCPKGTGVTVKGTCMGLESGADRTGKRSPAANVTITNRSFTATEDITLTLHFASKE